MFLFQGACLIIEDDIKTERNRKGIYLERLLILELC
jgi:hypothetical protein